MILSMFLKNHLTAISIVSEAETDPLILYTAAVYDPRHGSDAAESVPPKDLPNDYVLHDEEALLHELDHNQAVPDDAVLPRCRSDQSAFLKDAYAAGGEAAVLCCTPLLTQGDETGLSHQYG